MEAKYLASASEPEVKLAPPALATMSDASAEHAHVVLVEVQLTGVHSVASYVWRAASQSIQVGSTVVNSSSAWTMTSQTIELTLCLGPGSNSDQSSSRRL